ncbi:MAG: PAS domain S-box protein [Caldilineae bacterium]|nr:MAG: PAS domain S-box protein [Caldilineae bacterium]
MIQSRSSIGQAGRKRNCVPAAHGRILVTFCSSGIMSLSLFSSYRQRQLEALLEISRALTSRLDLPSLLRTILSYAAEIVGGEVGYIALTTPQGQLRLATGYGLPSKVYNALAPYLAQRKADGDFWNEAELRRHLGIVREASRLPLEQVIALPLVIEDEEVVGGIFLFRSGPAAFTAGDRSLLRDFADQAAIAVRNARQMEQLRAEKARVEAIIENSPNGVMILDPNLKVLIVNRAFSKLTGVSPQAARGRPCSEVLKLENTTGDHLCLSAAPPPPTSVWYGEGDIVRPGYKRVTVGINYYPLFDRNGHLLNVIATLTDITRFREAEELKSTFISVISHELKTPVSLIKGYASTLTRQDANWSPEMVNEIGRVIEEESDRLNHLINNLLDASRIQAGALELDIDDVSLAHVARTASERFQTQTEAHQIEFDFPPDLPLVRADERRIRQVFDNLISNAIKYSPEGGVIRVGAWAEEDRVVAYVADQGVGIPLDEQDSVFDRFYRVDSSLRRSTQGVGLGLFLVKAIVEAHGGEVWLRSQPQKGTTFFFALPRAE